MSGSRGAEPAGATGAAPAPARTRGVLVRWVAAAAVCSLILLPPLLGFLKYHEQGLLRPEALLLLAVLGGLGILVGAPVAWGGELVGAALLAGLLTLFLDLQFAWGRSLEPLLHELEIAGLTWRMAGGLLLAAVFAACFALCWLLRGHLLGVLGAVFGAIALSTLLLPVGKVPFGPQPVAAATEPRADLPPVVHLILDEHIGLDGIPLDLAGGPELRARLAAFFAEFGFRVYPRAYSLYYDTSDSIASLVNFAQSDDPASFFAEGAEGLTLARNAYFDLLAERGYAIRVYQADYMDYCAGAGVSYCFEYPAASPATLAGSNVGALERARIIASLYLEASFAYGTARVFYQKAVQRPARAAGLALPDWDWELSDLGPVPSLALLERLRADIARHPAGTAFFAHVLLPHYPYIFDAACVRRPVAAWEDRYDPAVAPPRENTAESRARKHALYFAQIDCLYRQLRPLLEALAQDGRLERATVIVHGDHGSRIAVQPPTGAAFRESSRRDFIDGLATLYAVRAPGLGSGPEPRQDAIQQLFAELWLERPAPAGPPFAYIRTGRDSLERAPMVELAAPEE